MSLAAIATIISAIGAILVPIIGWFIKRAQDRNRPPTLEEKAAAIVSQMDVFQDQLADARKTGDHARAESLRRGLRSLFDDLEAIRKQILNR